jgi:hypothetical protein
MDHDPIKAFQCDRAQGHEIATSKISPVSRILVLCINIEGSRLAIKQSGLGGLID